MSLKKKSKSLCWGLSKIPYNRQHKNSQWIQMVFPGWKRPESPALIKMSFTWLCQSHVTIKTSDVGEIHSLDKKSTSRASSSFSLDKNIFLTSPVNPVFLSHPLQTGRINYFLLLRNLWHHIRGALRVQRQ